MSFLVLVILHGLSHCLHTDVQRFDSRLMSPDGPSGLMHKVKRLLDNSSRVLDAKDKKELLEKLDHVVLHPR